MSDLGAIFHVKKDGVQYDAHAYTTLDECPEPNLKLTYKGQQAYVKLEAKGSGDVPCYVKKSENTVYQVKKEAVAPTGSIYIHIGNSATLTIPPMVKVLAVVATGYSDGTGSQHIRAYIGVTPNTSHTFFHTGKGSGSGYRHHLQCSTHSDLDITLHRYDEYLYLRWSDDINKQTPTISHYDS